MTGDNKKAKSDPAKKDAPVANKEGASGKEASKAKAGETATGAPSNYSRGEGQKPVTAAYKENWNVIFAKKNTNKKKR
jgi:hypothetical protein